MVEIMSKNINGKAYGAILRKIYEKWPHLRPASVVGLEGHYAIFAHQVVNLTEKVGEFAKAGRQYYGMARSMATWSEVADELADVIISAHVCAEAMEIDLRAAVARKLDVIVDRGGV